MLASFIVLALLSGAHLACSSSTQDRRDTGTSLLLYTDQGCSTPSASNPNVTLGLNVCAVTTGLESFILFPTPCTSGDVAVWMFTDVACGNPASSLDWYHGANGNIDCYATFKGAMAAVMLTCDANTDETEPSRPTSTTTIAVGPVANAATPATGGSTATMAAPPTSSSATSTSGTQDTPTANSNSSGWNSLDLGTRIGIIVALVVGVPPIFIGLYTIHLMKKKKQRK
jgi:hypothetical protein